MFGEKPGWSLSHQATRTPRLEPVPAANRLQRKTDQPTCPGQFLPTVSEWPLGPLMSSEAREAPVPWSVSLRSFVEPETRAASKAYPDHTATQTATRSALWPVPHPSSQHGSAV